MNYWFISTKKVVIIKKKRWTITNINEDVGELEPSYIDHGNVNCIVTLENNLSFLKKLNGDFPDGPMAKTLCSQCRGPGFNPRSGN